MYQLIADAGEFLVVDKTAGVPVHGPSPVPTLIERVRLDFNNPALNLVHRLDTGTSGLVLIAKTTDANRQLAELFACRAVSKRYLALSQLKPNKKQGWIIGDMVKVRDGNWKLKQSRDNPAKTYFVSAALKPQCRLFLLAPQTGKTHQLRVALRSQGAAILGDARYSNCPAERMYLHSWQLKFHYRGEDYAFMSWPRSGTLFLEPALQGIACEMELRLPEGS